MTTHDQNTTFYRSLAVGALVAIALVAWLVYFKNDPTGAIEDTTGGTVITRTSAPTTLADRCRSSAGLLSYYIQNGTLTENWRTDPNVSSDLKDVIAWYDANC